MCEKVSKQQQLESISHQPLGLLLTAIVLVLVMELFALAVVDHCVEESLSPNRNNRDNNTANKRVPKKKMHGWCMRIFTEGRSDVRAIDL